MSDDRPGWARRIVAERKARGWSQSAAIAALRGHSPEELPSDESLLREWKRWEAGETMPQWYRPLIAALFGTIEHAMFPQQGRYNPGRDDRDREVTEVSGLGMVELLQRLHTSDVDGATLDALRITTERLCCEYPHLPANQLAVEGRRWLEQLVGLQSQRLNLAQHREVLNLAGWQALLIGCVEYDQGERRASETTREVALSLGTETGDPDIIGWVHEMRAWIALTTGDYRGAIYASRAGMEAAGGQAVAAQLASQAAKAWARVGDRRQTEVALDQGRSILAGLPYPDNLDNHFVVDPAKFDFYAMDCYRVLGEDRLAQTLAEEVIRASTDFDGTERSPMRMAEARLTLGVVAGREGDIDSALAYGQQAFQATRQSVPHLIMVGEELRGVLETRYPGDPDVAEFSQRLRNLMPVR
ncbi:MAG TPA: XRE family transcriptional regulator [Chloroflexota bacterium]